MKKRNALYVLGDSPTKAAQAMGCSRQNVAAWTTDDYGNLTSRRVCDGVLAALVRRKYAIDVEGENLEMVNIDTDTLADLMRVPQDDEDQESQRAVAQAA